MSKAFCIGNGESRKGFDLEQLRPHGKIYGCNALYRDFTPDVLVAVDHGVCHEIYNSGYCQKNEAWFRDWTKVPAMHYEMMIYGAIDKITRDEIKDRMIKQFKASEKGFTANVINPIGKIVLAKYFCYIEVYDFSISEDETINLKDGIKNKLVTRLGLQVKLVDSETGLYMTGSGLGKATTTRELTLLNNENLEDVKFNQSSIGTSTKKALETAVAKVVKRMIRKKIFDH